MTEKCKAIGSNPKDPKVSNQKVHCELKMWYERDCKFRTCTIQPIFRSCCSMGLAPSPFCGEQPPLPVSPGNMFERFLSWPKLDDKVGDCDAALKNFTFRCLPFDQKTCGKVVFACPHWCSVFSYRKLP